MHYVPESAQDFLTREADSGDPGEPAGRNFHYQSAPVYALTLLVGGLLIADVLTDFIGDPGWSAYLSPFGLRLALLAAVLGGARIFYQTLEGLFERRVGADLALTIAAFAAILLGEPMTAALVVFIALCGESIEGYTLDRAQSAIRRIFDLRPKVAHVVRDDREIDLPLDEVRVGDQVVIRPGERVPVDGIVAAGLSSIDQSVLTGESMPVEKSCGAEVFTGTLNQYGSLSVTAQKVGTDTTLAQIVRLVAEATRQKTPLERTADRLARVFLPFVLGAALLTLVAWRFGSGTWLAGLKPALGVLVVACPCPLILATPTAVIAAMAWLARKGVVVKGSVALERLASINEIAFDKTGTLTRGEVQIDHIFVRPPLSDAELLRIAAIAERRSEHVLARLIVREAEARNLVVPLTEEFSAHPGAGIVAKVRATMLGPWADDLGTESIRTVLVGNRALVQSESVGIPPDVEEAMQWMEHKGLTTLLVAVDDHLVGAIGVRDAIRDESRSVIAALKQEGISRIALLTGDRPEPARAVADALGLIDDVKAGLFPADKARWVAEQTALGKRVAMVGDGVNDAPALASATVGLALGGVGSDIAAEAGDIVLMGDPLRPLPGLLRLGRALVRNIRQSIYLFAFGMNACGILLCAVGILSPVGGALFHEFSSLAVMLNATRLLWFERWDQSAVGRNSRRLSDGAEWLADRLSPTRIVFGLLNNWPAVVGVVAPLLVFCWLLSGVVQVGGDERALVTRFGKIEAELGPGLYWRFPPPFERVVRERPDQLRTVQIGFRAPEDRPSVAVEAPGLPVEWTSEHSEPGFETRAEESLILTGDEVLVETTAEVQWRICDLRQFAFGSAEPVQSLRAIAETVLREAAARHSLDDILTERRRTIEAESLATLRDRVHQQALGIEPVLISLLDIHPPREVVAAYRDVANALEDQEQQHNEAEAYYSAKLLSAAGERAVRILSGAASHSQTRADLSTVGGLSSWSLSDGLWAAITAETAGGHPLLSGEASKVISTAREAATATTQSARGNADRFTDLLGAYRSGRELTLANLYWETVVDSLSNRSVMVVDPKAAGHKRLFLGGTEGLRGGALLRDSESEPSPLRRPPEAAAEPPNVERAPSSQLEPEQ